MNVLLYALIQNLNILVSKKIFPFFSFPDINNICNRFWIAIHKEGECSLSNDSSKCLICSANDKFVFDPAVMGSECVESTACPYGRVAVLANDNNIINA